MNNADKSPIRNMVGWGYAERCGSERVNACAVSVTTWNRQNQSIIT